MMGSRVRVTQAALLRPGTYLIIHPAVLLPQPRHRGRRNRAFKEGAFHALALPHGSPHRICFGFILRHVRFCSNGAGAKSIRQNSASNHTCRKHPCSQEKARQGGAQGRRIHNRGRGESELSWRHRRLGQYRHQSLPSRRRRRLREDEAGRVYVRERHRRRGIPRCQKREKVLVDVLIDKGVYPPRSRVGSTIFGHMALRHVGVGDFPHRRSPSFLAVTISSAINASRKHCLGPSTFSPVASKARAYSFAFA